VREGDRGAGQVAGQCLERVAQDGRRKVQDYQLPAPTDRTLPRGRIGLMKKLLLGCVIALVCGASAFTPGVVTGKSSSNPRPPYLPENFSAKGRYLVPDLGIDVPFAFRGSNDNVTMIAGGQDYPIWFMNIIYGKPGQAKKLYTVTYRWPGVVQNVPCGAIGNIGRGSLNRWLARSSFVGREILQGNPNRRVNHWRVTATLPALPPGNFLRLPIALGDVYVDQNNRTTWRKVLHFGFQNLYDPEFDEWFELDTFKHKPGKVTLPKGCS
jgi:hypothetical protein